MLMLRGSCRSYRNTNRAAARPPPGVGRLSVVPRTFAVTPPCRQRGILPWRPTYHPVFNFHHAMRTIETWRRKYTTAASEMVEKSDTTQTGRISLTTLRPTSEFRALNAIARDMRESLESRNPNAAVDMFVSVVRANRQPTLGMYTELMRAYELRGQRTKCLSVLEEMEAAGVKPDARAIAVAINCISGSSNPDLNLVRSLLSRVTATRSTPPASVYTAAIFAASAANNLEEVEALMREFSEGAKESCTRLMYHEALLCALKVGNVEKGLHYLNILVSKGFEVAPKTIDVAFQLCAKSGEVHGVMTLIDFYKSRRALTEGLIATAMLTVISHGTNLEYHHLESLFSDAKQICDPEPVSESIFHIYTFGLALAGKLNRLMEVIGWWTGQGMPISKYLVFRLGEIIGKSVENVDTAYYAIEELIREGKPATTFCVNVILSACMICNDLARAWETYLALPQLGLRPNIDTFDFLLRCSTNARSSASVMRAWEEVERFIREAPPPHKEAAQASAVSEEKVESEETSESPVEEQVKSEDTGQQTETQQTEDEGEEAEIEMTHPQKPPALLQSLALDGLLAAKDRDAAVEFVKRAITNKWRAPTKYAMLYNTVRKEMQAAESSSE